MADGKENDVDDDSLRDVAALGVFANHQMILKVFPATAMEEQFRTKYKDFKSACLEFLKRVEENDDLETRTFEIDGEQYTMYYSEVGDKEAIFLMEGTHDHGYEATMSLDLTVTAIIDSLQDATNSVLKKTEGGDDGKLKTKPKGDRRASNVGYSSLEEVFRTIDANGDGVIDEEEFSAGLVNLGIDWKESTAKKVYAQIDAEDEGTIKFDAFMRFVMTDSNKKTWKELKRAVTSSIAMPSVKAIQESHIGPELYQKKLSQMEKLVNMMEESVVESQVDAQQQQYWKNKVLAHREFIRRHQDVVGRAMGSEASKLKKRLNELEKKNRRLSEFAVSMGADPEDDKSLKSKAGAGAGGKGKKNRRASDVSQTGAAGDDEDKELLLRRLRRENEEYKRKIQTQQQDLRKLQNEKKRSGSTTPRSASRRGGLAMDEKELQAAMTKLKKENYDLRNERNELRKERDSLATQLKAAKDKSDKLSKMIGPDEDMERLLARQKEDARQQRSKAKALRQEQIKLAGLSTRLTKMLQSLAKKIAAHDADKGQRILDREEQKDMIEELATQYMDMIDAFNALELKLKMLQKRKADMEKKHEVELKNKKDEVKAQKKVVKEREERIAELEDALRDKQQQFEEVNEQVAEMSDLRQQVKKHKRKNKDLQDEITQFEQMRENFQKEIGESKQREKNFKKQLTMIEKMPGNASMLKKIDRLHKQFLRMDQDGDGRLSWNEFKSGAAEAGFGETTDEQRDAFEAMDKNGDGFVEFEDFKQACLRNLERSTDKSDEEWRMTYKLLSKPPSKWNNEDVNLWLSHIGMKQYQEEMDNVDGNMLISMKQDGNLKEWGVQKSAHIRKFMREIKDLKARDDMLSNLVYENQQLQHNLDNLNKNGPTWQNVHTLQRKIRDLDGQVRKEKYARENIMINVKDALKKDKRFDNISPDYEDVLAEVALLKGALADANQKMTNRDKKKPDTGSAYENDSSAPDKLKNYGQPIGRFLQKWYVLANHSTQYWISRTNEELGKRDQHYKKLKVARKRKKRPKKRGGGDDDDDDDDDAKYDDEDEDSEPEEERDEEYTESLDWIIFDTRHKRLISEVRVQGRGAPNDPKNMKVQMSASPSGPWTTVKDHQMHNDGQREKVGGFEAEARFWRVVFLSNYGEQHPDSPRYVLYECQFWGPLDEEVENTHFVIE